MQDVKSLLRRELQLNIIAYIIIVVLLVTVSLFGAMLLAGLGAKDIWILTNQFARVLIPGLLLMVVLYMADTHRRLRAALNSTHEALVRTQEDLRLSRDRIAFAHQIATTVGAISERNALRQALRESVQHFGADAAAVVTNDDEVEVVTEDTDSLETVRSVALDAALESVRSGTPELFTLSEEGYEVVAAPLRMGGRLHAVACLMRRDEKFSEEDARGLELISRVLELSLQNLTLLTDMRSQLRGVLTVLSSLIEQRQSGYSAHSVEVTNLSCAVGKALSMTETEIEDLKLAAHMHDVGMLYVAPELLNAQRNLSPEELAEVQQHPASGANLAENANFDSQVQEVILSHHERFNGDGYPRGLVGHEIPLGARIIAVCDSYDAMTRDRPYRRALSQAEALAELRRGSGTAYDPKVVKAFARALEERVGLTTLTQSTARAGYDDMSPEAGMGRSA